MRKRIANFLRKLDRAGAGQTPTHGREEMRLAAAALLVEAAVMDGHFDAAERATVRQLLAARFGLDAGEAQALIATAESEVAASHGIFRFTNAIKNHCSDTERIELIEMLWEVAYADGVLHDYEHNLLRRIAGLIYVTDRDRGLARNRVLARLGLARGRAASKR
jgi:uncharacterized tellurite resistance protein B-like protein